MVCYSKSSECGVDNGGHTDCPAPLREPPPHRDPQLTTVARVLNTAVGWRHPRVQAHYHENVPPRTLLNNNNPVISQSACRPDWVRSVHHICRGSQSPHYRFYYDAIISTTALLSSSNVRRYRQN